MVTTVFITYIILKVISTKIQVCKSAEQPQIFRPLEKKILGKTERFQPSKCENDVRDDIKTIFGGIQCF
jgi:hypothetical protein